MQMTYRKGLRQTNYSHLLSTKEKEKRLDGLARLSSGPTWEFSWGFLHINYKQNSDFASKCLFHRQIN